MAQLGCTPGSAPGPTPGPREDGSAPGVYAQGLGLPASLLSSSVHFPEGITGSPMSLGSGPWFAVQVKNLGYWEVM